MDSSTAKSAYEQTSRRLAKAGVDSTLAEAHGLLCGLLCATKQDVRQRWLEEIFDPEDANTPAVEACRQPLVDLYIKTLAALRDPELDFALLLPGDEQPLKQRTEELVDWCQGFLYGIGLSGTDLNHHLSEEGSEALRDITEITRLDTETAEENEDNEHAFFELTEFVRLAALIIREELMHGQEAAHDLH
jgi:yecA family protein